MKLLILLALTPLALAAVSGNPELPDYIPNCASPQPTAPLQTIGGSQVFFGAGTAIAFNGQDFGTAWTESNQLKFRRLFADGSPNGPIMVVAGVFANTGYRPSLVWNGTGYGVAVNAYYLGYNSIFFARLNADGTLASGGSANPEVVSFFGVAPTAQSYLPVVAWGGGLYAVAWQDNRGANAPDIYATLLNSDGTVANGGAAHDLVISNAALNQAAPAIAWNTSGNAFLIVWQDSRDGTGTDLYRSLVYPNGVVGGNSNTVVSTGSYNAYSPSLVDTGAGLGLAWYDNRTSVNYEIYFARLEGNNGSKIGADVRLTSDPSGAYYPAVAWTGSEYGVFWGDFRFGTRDNWFQRVSSAGAAIGPNVQITSTPDMGIHPQAAFGRRGYLLTAIPYIGSYYPNYSVPVGCAADVTPPTCPANFFAYNITGTSASVSWSPVSDGESDLAYYGVYRNNVLIGKTGVEYYNDAGPLNLSGTYNYMIQPVNAWQLQNTACTASIYVKTNSSLTLTMNKSNPHAVLNWTDAGFNNYNVFRGNSPQVMQQIGATPALTTPDPNVLDSTLSYFYSVDNPGP